jgi:hypothetical protein
LFPLVPAVASALRAALQQFRRAVFSNEFRAFDPFAPRPAALPSAVALVFSLIFTSRPAAFAAMQYGPGAATFLDG